MRRCNSILAVALAATALATAPNVPAHAAPFQFTFTDTIGDSVNPLVPFGTTATVIVTADNGGTSTINQSWNLADILSATLSAGAYFATYNAPYFPPILNPVFHTNAAGALTAAGFGGTLDFGQGTDTFGSGGSLQLASNAFLATTGHYAFFRNGGMSPPINLSYWTGPAPTGVPEPASLALLGFGLAALGFAHRRRRA